MKTSNMLAVWFLAAGAAVAWGGSIIPDPSLNAATGGGPCGGTEQVTPPGGSASESATACNMQPGAGTATFTGSATASYSALHAFAAMTLVNATFSSQQSYSSYARLIDNLDVLSGSNITSLALAISIDGTWSNAGLSFVKPVLSFGFDYGDTGSLAPAAVQTNLPLSNGTVNMLFVTPSYPIADFENYDYFISLALQIFAPAGTNLNESGMLDFSNTASIAYVIPTDANGNVVTSAVISTTGLQNTGGGDLALAPEPASWALACAAAVAMAWKGRRKPR